MNDMNPAGKEVEVDEVYSDNRFEGILRTEGFLIEESSEILRIAEWKLNDLAGSIPPPECENKPPETEPDCWLAKMMVAQSELRSILEKIRLRINTI